jgi:hypothetical protein
MADAIHGNTELGATKQDLIANIVQRELIAGSILAPYCYNVSQYCEPGAKTVEFPKAGHFTVVDRVEGAAGDATVLTYATDVLSLDQNAYVSWIVDYMSKVQSRIDVQMDLAGRAANAHAKYLDGRILAQMEAAGDATTTAGAVSYAILTEMMQTFMTRLGDKAKGFWTFGPSAWGTLIGLDEFKRADVYGNSAVPSGSIGSIFGLPVVINPQVGLNTFYLADKEAIAYGVQAGPSYSEQGANEFGSQAKRCVLDQIFGVKALFINQEGAGAAESALIIKDNN